MVLQNEYSSSPIWIYPHKNVQLHESIVREFKIHPITAQILISRGFQKGKEIHEYLYGKLPHLFAPDLFTGIDQASKRVLKAIQTKEKILIYGDHDVDGISATALLCEFFRSLGLSVFFFFPYRASFSQENQKELIQTCLEKKCTLVITVDCSLSSQKQMDSLFQHGIDLVITDHHEIMTPLPKSIPILNPKLLNSTYPNRDLTGVGVAFKLAHAVANELIEKELLLASKVDLKSYLDLVALGTIADMGSLRGENRILVRYGLKIMKKRKRLGLAKLLKSCDVSFDDLSPSEIASKVAPKLNSLGRVADPSLGAQLLLCSNPTRAEELIQKLDQHNLERKQAEKTAFIDLDEQLFQNPNLLKEKTLFFASSTWHPGIIPILASRLAKQFNRPTMIIAIDQNVGKGSIRTIAEFPLLSVLKQNKELLIDFGGHEYAAGFTIEKEKIPFFRKAFEKAVHDSLQEQDILSKIQLDAKVDFDQITFDFMESFNLLAPFGHDNPPPLLYSEVIQVWLPKLVGKDHLKLFLEQNDRTLEGIAFGLGHRRAEILRRNLPLQIAFTPQINSFLNKASIQLHIKDFRLL